MRLVATPSLCALPLLLLGVPAAAEGVETSSTAHTSSAASPSGGPVLDLPDEVEEEAEKGGTIESLAERTESIIDRVSLGGYGEHEFEAGEGRVAQFRAHRYVLFVHGRISDRISTSTEIEFEFGGSPAKRDGILGFGEVLLEFSVVDVELWEWLVLRAGIILTPVGAFNLRHDAPTRDLTARPIAYTSIVPTTWFETGAGALGQIPLGGTHHLSYELYVVNGLDARIFDGTGLRAARGSHFEDNNHDKGIAGRVAYSPMLALEVGLSGYTGEYDLSGNRVNLANLDATFRSGPFEMIGEGVLAQIDEGFVEGFSASSIANVRTPVPTQMAGFYIQGNYHFTIPPLWALFGDWLSEATFTGVIRYEGKDTDTSVSSALGDQRRLTFGLNFRPVEAFVLKTDYQLNSSGTNGVQGAPDLWSGEFWSETRFGFMSSVAFLF